MTKRKWSERIVTKSSMMTNLYDFSHFMAEYEEVIDFV